MTLFIKDTITDGGSTMLYAADTVYSVDTVDTVNFIQTAYKYIWLEQHGNMAIRHYGLKYKSQLNWAINQLCR